jgi:hypothetical protein
VLALSAPLAAGRWSLAILGIPLIVLSVAEAYAAFVSPQRAEASAYLPSLLAMLLGNILLLSSALVLDGLLVLLVALLALDGSSKILTAWPKTVSARVPATINGLMDFGCAALLWYLSGLIGAERAIGLIIGAYIAAAGWRMLMAPVAAIPEVAAGATTAHPDIQLGLSSECDFCSLARAERKWLEDGARH